MLSSSLYIYVNCLYYNMDDKRAVRTSERSTFSHCILLSNLFVNCFKKKWHQLPMRVNCNLFSKLSKKTSNLVLMRLCDSTISFVRYYLSESKVVLYM